MLLLDSAAVRAPLSAASISNLSYLRSEAQSCHLLFVSGTGEGSADLTEVGCRFTRVTVTNRIHVKARRDTHQPTSPYMLEEMDLAISKSFHGCWEDFYIRFTVKNSLRVNSRLPGGCRFSSLTVSQVFWDAASGGNDVMSNSRRHRRLQQTFSRPFFLSRCVQKMVENLVSLNSVEKVIFYSSVWVFVDCLN